jgi:polyisoprenoid-binding protein YceI
MVKKFLLVALLSLSSFALELVDGTITAHTEVFGDSTINPATDKIDIDLSMGESVTTLNGIVSINSANLISDNLDRDKHMYEVLNIEKYPKISFNIKSIKEIDKEYLINGVLNLHSTSKELDIIATIKESKNTLLLDSNFSIKMSDFGMEPPKILFLKVRDLVDLSIHLNLKK